MIVVIGILAAITLVAYNGIQDRANDTRRISDAKSIQNAIELYAVENGSYPPVAIGGTAMSGWEASSLEPAGQFLRPLVDRGIASSVPVDPVNNATSAAMTNSENTFSYAYYVYGSGSSGCDSSRGAYYVLGILRTAAHGRAKHPESPGFACSGRDWQNTFSWVTGGYLN